MPLPQAVIGFALLAGLLTVIPGIDTALIVRGALVQSRSYAFALAAGIQTGTMLWGAGAALGASALLAASEVGYRVLTVAGACYLTWMGIGMIVQSFRSSELPTDSPSENSDLGTSGRGLLGGWSRGLITNLLNPKVGVFYMATVPQFVPLGISPLLMGLVLAAVHCTLGTAWSVAMIAAASTMGRRLRTESMVRWMDRTAGAVLVGFGLKLAAETRL